MPDELLPAHEAARRLGMSVTTLYDWLGQSDKSLLVIRGHSVTIDYFQGGSRGQGRIQIESVEIERLREIMRVRPMHGPLRRRPIRRDAFPGIDVALGRPDDKK
jgi:hypothetical protein